MVRKIKVFVIIHPFCGSSMWIDEMCVGITFGKPSSGGADTGGGVGVDSAVALGAIVGEGGGTGCRTETFAVQANDAIRRIKPINLIRMRSPH